MASLEKWPDSALCLLSDPPCVINQPQNRCLSRRLITSRLLPWSFRRAKGFDICMLRSVADCVLAYLPTWPESAGSRLRRLRLSSHHAGNSEHTKLSSHPFLHEAGMECHDSSSRIIYHSSILPREIPTWTYPQPSSVIMFSPSS